MSLVLCSTALQQLKHQCVINTVFLLEPKDIIIPDTLKKTIQIQLKLRHESLRFPMGKGYINPRLLMSTTHLLNTYHRSLLTFQTTVLCNTDKSASVQAAKVTEAEERTKKVK